MKSGVERDTLTGFLKDLDTRLTRQERHSHHGTTSGGGGGGAQGPMGPTGPAGPAGPTGPQGPPGEGATGGVEEVFVGNDDPGAPYELWYDPDAVSTTVPAAADEVWVGPTEPTAPTTELWFDTDAVSAMQSLASEVAALRAEVEMLRPKRRSGKTKRD